MLRLNPMQVVKTFLVSAVLLTASLPVASATPTNRQTLIEYIQGRDDLSRKERKLWERRIRLRFGGTALDEETPETVELGVAKSILSAAIFMRASPKQAADAAWEGWRGALGYVPPPIAIHYQILSLEGRKPRGRMIDLAFKFPDYYTDEIAPDLVAYWEDGLEAGTIPDEALLDTREALAATRLKMRPLLLDKLRLLSRLARDQAAARGARSAEVQSDIKAVEAELTRSFKRVAQRPEVLDARKRPFDRLRIQLELMGQKPSAEDRLLDPDAPPPPKRAVPIEEPPVEVKPPEPEAKPLFEPDRPPPPPPPPPQVRPGDPDKTLKPMTDFSLQNLITRYRKRLSGVIKAWIGTPYKWGGTLKRLGTDCSGFVRGVFREGFDVDLPRVSRDQYRTGFSVPRDSLQPGDLVFFDTQDRGRINHVGVYVGDGRMVHASSTRGVIEVDLGARYYRRAYRGARRILAYP